MAANCHSVLMFLSTILKTNLVKNCFIFSPLERISLSEVTMSQLIAYDPERDLLPVILAHCNYSLEVGQETLVEYDWTALERQLTDRFLKGRPFVEFKVRPLLFLINFVSRLNLSSRGEMCNCRGLKFPIALLSKPTDRRTHAYNQRWCLLPVQLSFKIVYFFREHVHQ